ncbi:MAG TPA: hypothetical protein VG984_03820 [Candidatus Paceibacterota bacterium]|nr:hypothetical protein [Candidatus Paceibacterota bacterium]
MAAKAPITVGTFYHECICSHCRKKYLLPVEKNLNAIPPDRLEQVVKNLEAGKKMLWPYNPASEEEVREFLKGKKCPKGHPYHHENFVWATGAI